MRVNLVRVDFVRVDLVGVDFVGGHQICLARRILFMLNMVS